MFDSTQFTKAALILGQAQKDIEKLIGVNISLQFEIKTDKQLSAKDVIRIVANVTNHETIDITGHIKTNDLCYARYACYYLMRNYLNMTYHKIGQVTGKTHTTVLSGLKVLSFETNNKVLQKIVKESEEAFIKWMNK